MGIFGGNNRLKEAAEMEDIGHIAEGELESHKVVGEAGIAAGDTLESLDVSKI